MNEVQKISREDFEAYLKAAGLHNIQNYECNKCGEYGGSSCSNLQRRCKCGGTVVGLGKKPYKLVYFQEYTAYKAAGMIDWELEG